MPYLDTRARAPLGNKTTNAKARPDQPVAVKDRVREIEKSQLKSAISQKPKQRSTEIAPSKFTVQPDKEEAEEEPEYAPPAPKELPYESDVLPKGGLTFEGLKEKNLFKGYYEHFYNPTDDNGVSRSEKTFNTEMETALEQAIEDNERESAALDWSVSDVPETAKLFSTKAVSQASTNENRVEVKEKTGSKPVSHTASRRAASALAIRADTRKDTSRINAGTRSTQKHSAISTSNSAKPVAQKFPPHGTTAGEAASRTTLGYNKGRTASSLVRPKKTESTAQFRSHKAEPPSDELLGRTATLSHACTTGASHTGDSGRPTFMSIFDDDDDNEGLPSMRGLPSWLGEGAEDEFELKLEV